MLYFVLIFVHNSNTKPLHYFSIAGKPTEDEEYKKKKYIYRTGSPPSSKLKKVIKMIIMQVIAEKIIV
jgi:hypothetical protein